MSGIRFLEFLSNDELAFDELYCVAFKLMDAHWLAKRASYMEFNVSKFLILFFFYLKVVKLKLLHFAGGYEIHKNATGARTVT